MEKPAIEVSAHWQGTQVLVALNGKCRSNRLNPAAGEIFTLYLNSPALGYLFWPLHWVSVSFVLRKQCSLGMSI